MLTLLSLLIISSCEQPALITTQGGSWTFEALGYNALSVWTDTASAKINASGRSNNNNFGMSFNFLNGYPHAPGTYTIVNAHNTGRLPAGNFVAITANITGSNSASYYSTGGGGTQTLTLGFTNGKVSMTGNNIELLNTSNASDSSTLSFNITQTQ